MDKEMLAKMNEVLKANGRRELSMDEVEKVNGGYIWDEMGEEAFNNMFMNLTRSIGYDAAYKVLIDLTGFDYYVYGNGGTFVNVGSGEDKMDEVLHKFWELQRNGGFSN